MYVHLLFLISVHCHSNIVYINKTSNNDDNKDDIKINENNNMEIIFEGYLLNESSYLKKMRKRWMI